VNPDISAEVRKDVCNWLERHGNDIIPKLNNQVGQVTKYTDFIAGMLTLTEQSLTKEQGNEFEFYLTKMRRTGTWGDHLALQAAAEVYHATIHIYTLRDDVLHQDIIKPHLSEPDQTFRLAYWEDSHYESLKLQAGLKKDSVSISTTEDCSKSEDESLHESEIKQNAVLMKCFTSKYLIRKVVPQKESEATQKEKMQEMVDLRSRVLSAYFVITLVWITTLNAFNAKRQLYILNANSAGVVFLCFVGMTIGLQFILMVLHRLWTLVTSFIPNVLLVPKNVKVRLPSVQKKKYSFLEPEEEHIVVIIESEPTSTAASTIELNTIQQAARDSIESPKLSPLLSSGQAPKPLDGGTGADLTIENAANK